MLTSLFFLLRFDCVDVFPHQVLVVRVWVWPRGPERTTPGRPLLSQPTAVWQSAAVTFRKQEVFRPRVSSVQHSNISQLLTSSQLLLFSPRCVWGSLSSFFFCAARISCLFDSCFQWSWVYDWVYQSSLSMVLSARRLLFIANVIVGPFLVAWLKTNMSLLNFHFLELIRFDSLPFSPNMMEPTAPVCRAGGWVPKTLRRASWAQNCSNLISSNNALWLVLVVNMWDQWSLLRNRLGSPQRTGNPFICVV